MYFLPMHFTIRRQFSISQTSTYHNILPIANLTLKQENYLQRSVNKISQIPVFLLIFLISNKISFQSHLSSQVVAFSNVKLQTALFLFPPMSHRD